jgi:hypothetical protein
VFLKRVISHAHFDEEDHVHWSYFYRICLFLNAPLPIDTMVNTCSIYRKWWTWSFHKNIIFIKTAHIESNFCFSTDFMKTEGSSTCSFDITVKIDMGIVKYSTMSSECFETYESTVRQSVTKIVCLKLILISSAFSLKSYTSTSVSWIYSDFHRSIILHKVNPRKSEKKYYFVSPNQETMKFK